MAQQIREGIKDITCLTGEIRNEIFKIIIAETIVTRSQRTLTQIYASNEIRPIVNLKIKSTIKINNW